MTRWEKRRTWRSMNDVPAQLLDLVREALPVRLRTVVTRQSLTFLQRCKSTGLETRFIRNKKLRELCTAPEHPHRNMAIYKSLVWATTKQKQYMLHSSLLKCSSEESPTAGYLMDRYWELEAGRRRSVMLFGPEQNPPFVRSSTFLRVKMCESEARSGKNYICLVVR